MLIIICSKCGYKPTGKDFNCPKCDMSDELIIKHNNIYVISPRFGRWKVVTGIGLLLFTLVFIVTNYPALAAICFIAGLTLALYDKFQCL